MKVSGRILIAATAALTIALLSGPARAEIHDFFRCALKDGKTVADYEAVTAEFRAAADAAGYADYKVQVLAPLYSADVGVLWWHGTSPNMTRLGAAWDWWLSSETARPIDAKFQAIAKCDQRSLHTVAF